MINNRSNIGSNRSLYSDFRPQIGPYTQIFDLWEPFGFPREPRRRNYRNLCDAWDAQSEEKHGIYVCKRTFAVMRFLFEKI